VNLKQAAARLGVHYQTAYRWVRSGDLAAVRVGPRYEVSDAAIHQFIAARNSVLLQAVPRPAAAPGAAAPADTDARDDVLEELEGFAADPLLTVPSVAAYAARRGSTALGDLCLVSVTRPDGNVEHVALDHPEPMRTAFVGAALDMTNPERRGPVAPLARVMEEGRPLRVPHVAQDQLRAAIRPELRQYLAEYPILAMLAVPVRVPGADPEIGGLLVFVRDGLTRTYTAEDEAFAERFADRVGVLVAAARDITESWDARAEHARRFQAWVDASPGAVLDPDACMEVLQAPGAPVGATIVFDATGRIVGANAAAGHAGGYEPGLLVGRSFEEVLDEDQLPTERANFARLAGGELDYHDFHGQRVRSSGEQLAFALHRVAIRRPDRSLVCIVSVGRPIRLTARIKDLIGAT
jgi:excisionase family DNA binding protein/PAS domain S-box-containing protein